MIKTGTAAIRISTFRCEEQGKKIKSGRAAIQVEFKLLGVRDKAK